MKVFRILMTVAVLLSLLQGCSSGDEDGVSGGDMSRDNTELAEMVAVDQEMRMSEDTDPRLEYATDQAHRKKVFELLSRGGVSTAVDHYRAALLLQHTPIIMCGEELISESRENYLLAHHLAMRAAEMGYAPARRMVAMTIDRYLWYSGLPQKYGTNYRIDEETGKKILEPLDPGTTDEERAVWDVEPLSALRGE